jgi:hypothetical protein
LVSGLRRHGPIWRRRATFQDGADLVLLPLLFLRVVANFLATSADALGRDRQDASFVTTPFPAIATLSTNNFIQHF